MSVTSVSVTSGVLVFIQTRDRSHSLWQATHLRISSAQYLNTAATSRAGVGLVDAATPLTAATAAPWRPNSASGADDTTSRSTCTAARDLTGSCCSRSCGRLHRAKRLMAAAVGLCTEAAEFRFLESLSPVPETAVRCRAIPAAAVTSLESLISSSASLLLQSPNTSSGNCRIIAVFVPTQQRQGPGWTSDGASLVLAASVSQVVPCNGISLVGMSYQVQPVV